MTVTHTCNKRWAGWGKGGAYMGTEKGSLPFCQSQEQVFHYGEISLEGGMAGLL